MEYKVVTSNHASDLTSKVNALIQDGFECVGSHHVVETHRQNRYSGAQHMDSVIQSEYSQTMVKK